jgi:hypothetical protein
VVAVVAHPDFEALTPLAERVHVWLVDTPANRARAETYWRAHPEHSIDHGITTFKVREHAAPDQIVLEALGPLDLHHGEYSHNPPWEVVEVYGATPTVELREVLQDMGVTEVSSIPGGFCATRSGSSAA